MRLSIRSRGAMLALAAATFAMSNVAVSAPAAAAEAKVQCYGINECKGHGSNTCKGLGVLKVTRAKCLAAGGKIVG